MISRVRYQFFVACIAIMYSFPTETTITIKGDAAAQDNETFSFPIHQIQGSNNGHSLYVCAREKPSTHGGNGSFSVARLTTNSKFFEPLAPETATLNNESSVNPLFDAPIKLCTLLEFDGGGIAGAQEHPAVVTHQEPSTVYIFNHSSANNVVLYSVPDLKDADNNPNATIIALEGGRGSIVFAAVAPDGGSFGDLGSGISVIAPLQKNSIENNIKKSFVAPGVLHDLPFAFDNNSESITINAPAVTTISAVDLHWNPYINRLFVALQTTASMTPDAGARSVVVGRIENNALIFEKIAPDNAFIGLATAIVGTRGAEGSAPTQPNLSAFKVRSMFTSSHLNYLIVLGGNGTDPILQQTVSAIPLVSFTGIPNSTDTSLQGTVANKNSNPHRTFFTDQQKTVRSINFIEPAQSPSDMTLSDDIAAQVGGGPLPNGPITDIIIKGDTVFVTVQSPLPNYKPGLFMSQALLDSQGKIKGWTPWTRTGGTIDQIVGHSFNTTNGIHTFATGPDSTTVKTVLQTEWNAGDAAKTLPLSLLIEAEFGQSDGGIEHIKNFPLTTPGLFECSLCAVTGNKKVALIETGRITNGTFCPTFGDAFINAHKTYLNGAIDELPANETRTLVFSGGVLDELGPIESSAIITHNNNGWLCVGGINGLAILSTNDGSGWDTANNKLAPGFNGLTATMSFKKVNQYRFVKKLIADGQFLYVLTDTSLDRIDLSQGSIGLGAATVTRIADVTLLPTLSSHATLLDCFISNKLAVLATSQGMLRIGNSKNAQTVADTATAQWTPVTLAEDAGPIAKLIPISPTELDTAIAQQANGGMLLALSSYAGKRQSRLYRFSVMPTATTAISDTTIEQLPDQFIKDTPTYFVDFGDTVNQCSSDGILYIHGRGIDASNPIKKEQSPQLKTILPINGNITSGTHFTGRHAVSLPLSIDGFTSLTGITRNYAAGNWLITGDKGLRTNE